MNLHTPAEPKGFASRPLSPPTRAALLAAAAVLLAVPFPFLLREAASRPAALAVAGAWGLAALAGLGSLREARRGWRARVDELRAENDALRAALEGREGPPGGPPAPASGEAEAALRESEERYRMFVRHSSEGIWRFEFEKPVRTDLSPEAQVDAAYRYGYLAECNDAMARMYGFEEAESLVGSRMVDLLPPTDPANREYLLAFVHSGYQLSEAESHEVHRDGSTRWFLNNLVGIVEGGEVVRVWGTQHDITIRKEAERALRESEERFRQLAENIRDVFYINGADRTGLLYLSPAYEKVWGHPVESALSARSWKESVHPDDLPRLDQVFRSAPDGEYEVEYRIVRPDGEVRCIRDRAFAIRDGDGRIVRYAGVAEDVTERKRADEELRRGEARFRMLFDGVSDAVFVYELEEDGEVTLLREVNAVACERLGYTREEMLRRHPLDFDAPESLPESEAAMETLRGEGRVMGERVHVARDGTRIPVEVNARAIQLDGRTTVISIARDIRERKRVEEALRESQEQLLHAQKMEAVGRLAGGVAHDFNNMLTAIKGFAQLLLLDLPIESPLREYVEEIQRAAERSADLTRQLLAFSRRQILQPKVLDLNQVVRDMDRMLRRVIGEDVELAHALEPRADRVRADPGQLEQVIMNLAVNARDAMPHGGKLRLETRNVEVRADDVVHPPFLRPGRYVGLSVRDTGRGMDPEVHAHVFEPFFTTKAQGTGLGLATVYGIVKQSDGYVWAESEPGRGSCFHVLLPRVEAAPQPAYAQEGPPAALSEGVGTVLLVEDEPAVRRLTHRVLLRSGYRVLEAGSGPEALRVFEGEEGRIDLLVTDVVMPGMGGPELVGHLASRSPAMRVLYMSGYADDAVVRQGLLTPGNRFLSKPFTPEALAWKVREVLEES